ncbi:MAG: CBS domain-containing protein [Candidatus Thermoplasmatota archaeon]|nr:CBS domain-containing protein [Candidatus Thermoplasmatota archaeon]
MESVQSIMTPDPVIFSLPSTVAQAVSVLIKNNITGMPVVNSSGKYVGIISRRDVFANPEETQATRITRSEPSIRDDTEIREAAILMVKEKRRHAAIVNSRDEVIGILTPQDFLKTIEKTYGNILVKEVMKSLAFPIWEKTPLPVVYRSMKLTGIFTYPVTDSHGNFKGLITDRDLFDKIDVSTVRVDDVETVSDDDPWSWDSVRNVVSYFIEKNHLKIPEDPAESIAIGKPVVANLNERLALVARKMRDGNFNQLPVTSSVNGLEGILTDLDILAVFLKEK